jgi:hypothetical protein
LPTFAREFYTETRRTLELQPAVRILELLKNAFAGLLSVDDARPRTFTGISWSAILGTPQRGRRLDPDGANLPAGQGHRDQVCSDQGAVPCRSRVAAGS